MTLTPPASHIDMTLWQLKTTPVTPNTVWEKSCPSRRHPNWLEHMWPGQELQDVLDHPSLLRSPASEKQERHGRDYMLFAIRVWHRRLDGQFIISQTYGVPVSPKELSILSNTSSCTLKQTVHPTFFHSHSHAHCLFELFLQAGKCKDSVTEMSNKMFISNAVLYKKKNDWHNKYLVRQY